MSNPLAVTLVPSLARTTSGSGGPIDIGALRTAARLVLSVTAASATADRLLAVAVETSTSDAGPWAVVGQFATVQATGDVEAHVANLKRFVRVTWTISGAAASFTFDVTGLAHVLYAEPKHVRGIGIQKAALAKVPDNDLVEFCIVASVESDGYLGGGFTLPLSAWGEDLRLHNSKLAVYHYCNGIGRQPTGPDDIIDTGYANAIKWLKGVAGGSIVPVGIVDATPEIEERSFAVVSSPLRGY